MAKQQTKTIAGQLRLAADLVEKYGIEPDDVVAISVDSFFDIDLHLEPAALIKVASACGVSIHSRASNDLVTHFIFVADGAKWTGCTK